MMLCREIVVSLPMAFGELHLDVILFFGRDWRVSIIIIRKMLKM